ncbi:MAG: hypothetical protein JWR19_2161 [Pedosphaera sp.]|nr:hypothetical protein [Pedosphaera sp.]
MTIERLPKFESDVDELFLRGATPHEQYALRQQSIQRQQNEWMMRRLIEGDARFDRADEAREEMKLQIEKISARVEPFEKLKERLSGKWSVVSFLCGVIVIPVALSLVGALFVRLIEKVWK